MPLTVAAAVIRQLVIVKASVMTWPLRLDAVREYLLASGLFFFFLPFLATSKCNCESCDVVGHENPVVD